MPSEIYYRLRDQLDQYSFGFPSTESGIELKILKKLFTEEEAGIFLSLTPQLQTPEEVARCIDRNIDEVAVLLDQMAEKGLLFRLRKEKFSRYGAPAFVAGIFEFQLPKTTSISVKIYDVLGREVRVLADQPFHAGVHRINWDGLDNTGRKVATGMYFYRLEADGVSISRKMVLLK